MEMKMDFHLGDENELSMTNEPLSRIFSQSTSILQNISLMTR